MDPSTIATAAIAVLSPYVKDVGRELAKTVGEVGVKKARGLLTWLKQQFAEDPAAAKDLSRFEKDPDKFEPALQATIDEKSQAEPNFAEELKKRLDELGPEIVVFQRIKDGRGIVGVSADTIRSGKITVTQEADKIDSMTGLRVKTID
jgi:hypothetical protein